MLKSPDGEHTVSVPITIGDSHVVANVARQILRWTPRELQREYAEAVADELEAGEKNLADDLGAVALAAEDNAFGVTAEQMIPHEGASYVVSSKPFMARGAYNYATHEVGLYESVSMNERTWSDGHIDYQCVDCDYSGTKVQVIGHRKTHRKRIKQPPIVAVIKGDVTPRADRLAREIERAMQAVPEGPGWARLLAEHIVKERQENRVEPEDEGPLDDDAVLERIRRLVLRNDARRVEEEVAPLRAKIEALETALNDAATRAETAEADARRVCETLATFVELAREEGVTDGRGT